jgi:hypothetical protein
MALFSPPPKSLNCIGVAPTKRIKVKRTMIKAILRVAFCFSFLATPAWAGTCGSANGVPASSAPTTNLCSSGKASNVAADGVVTVSSAQLGYLLGGIDRRMRNTRGDRKRPADRSIVITARSQVYTRPAFCDSVLVISADDSLLDDVEMLKRLVPAGAADLARARAEASSAAALIAHLKLQIEKLQRELYGPRSERTARLLYQLELQLEELEMAANEDEIAAEQAASSAGDTIPVRPFTRKKPSRKPFSAHLPRERVIVPGPTACLCCGRGAARSTASRIASE